MTAPLKPGHDGHAYNEYRDADGRLLISTVWIDGMDHGYPVDPGGDGKDAGGSNGSSLGGKPSYGRDQGLYFAYYAAELFGLVD